MRILFDHCVPKPFRMAFPTHEIRTAAQMGWQGLQNGALLKAAAGAFDVLLTVDKNIQFQHNLAKLPLPIIVLDVIMNTPEALLPFAPFVESILPGLRAGQMVEIDLRGIIRDINPTESE